MTKTYYSKRGTSLLLSLYTRYSEKQQRHFLATERLRLGARSVAYLCRVFSCSPKRVYAGLAELAQIRQRDEQVDYGRQRRSGGGAKKKR
jgi:hypothetical protein